MTGMTGMTGSGTWALHVPPTTTHPLHGAVVALVNSAEEHHLITATTAVVLRAAAGLHRDTDPQSLGIRADGLLQLAHARSGWEPDTLGIPRLDGEIGQVVRLLSTSGMSAPAWRALCRAVDVDSPQAITRALTDLVGPQPDPGTGLDITAVTQTPTDPARVAVLDAQACGWLTPSDGAIIARCLEEGTPATRVRGLRTLAMAERHCLTDGLNLDGIPVDLLHPILAGLMPATDDATRDVRWRRITRHAAEVELLGQITSMREATDILGMARTDLAGALDDAAGVTR
ncbi:MAG: hypothetical protein HYR62_02075 [Actinobacteria bacterium]|nr:hypothetical protein [Actinomycetota bacterium]MBI3687271.1 hypothetical protein [Actinomycetota bacterium]